MMSFKQDWMGKSRLTMIIGCGRLGSTLADILSTEGENVIIMDKDESSFRKLSPFFAGMNIVGDATNEKDLEQAEIGQVDHLVVCTNNDNTNIMVAQLAKEYFNVPHIICRLFDPQRECVYKEFGIKTICPTTLSSLAIKQMMNNENSGKKGL